MRKLCTAIFVLGAGGAAAQAPAPAPAGSWLDAAKGRIETVAGAGLEGNGFSSYAGLAVGLGSDLSAQGWRLRLLSSHAQYSYAQTCIESRECDDLAGIPEDYLLNPTGIRALRRIDHAVERTGGELLAGYSFHLAPVYLKLYAGLELSDLLITPDDRERAGGLAMGGRIAAELWGELAPGLWASFDAAAGTTNGDVSAQGRIGWSATPWLALGPEVAAFGDARNHSVHVGGFARFSVGGTEYTLSGGVTDADNGSTTDNSDVYGAFATYRRF